MKLTKLHHQAIITIVLTIMVAYSVLNETKRGWTTFIAGSILLVMITHPKDFVSVESSNTEAALWH